MPKNTTEEMKKRDKNFTKEKLNNAWITKSKKSVALTRASALLAEVVIHYLHQKNISSSNIPAYLGLKKPLHNFINYKNQGIPRKHLSQICEKIQADKRLARFAKNTCPNTFACVLELSEELENYQAEMAAKILTTLSSTINNPATLFVKTNIIQLEHHEVVFPLSKTNIK